MPDQQEPKKFVCTMEGCDAHHCRQCGRHYDPADAEGKRICDSCQIGAASLDAQWAAELHGNYQAADEAEGPR